MTPPSAHAAARLPESAQAASAAAPSQITIGRLLAQPLANHSKSNESPDSAPSLKLSFARLSLDHSLADGVLTSVACSLTLGPAPAGPYTLPPELGDLILEAAPTYEGRDKTVFADGHAA